MTEVPQPEDASHASWGALVRLWTTSPVANVLGATVILIVGVHGVLPHGSGTTLNRLTQGKQGERKRASA